MAPNPLLQLALIAAEKFGNRSPQAAFYRATAQEAAIKGWRQSKSIVVPDNTIVTINSNIFTEICTVNIKTSPNGKLCINASFCGSFVTEGGSLSVRLAVDSVIVPGVAFGTDNYPGPVFGGALTFLSGLKPGGSHDVTLFGRLLTNDDPDFVIAPTSSSDIDSASLTVAEVSF